MKKLKSIKVSMSDGTEKVIVYRPIEEIPTSHLICDKECPYGKCCSELPDPRNMEDEELSFTDFCNDLGAEDGSDSELTSMVPKDGSLEELFRGYPNVLQKIIGKKKLVYLNDVIDKCCPDICDYYNKEHTDCTLENKMCFLRGLFVGPVVTLEDNKPEDRETKE